MENKIYKILPEGLGEFMHALEDTAVFIFIGVENATELRQSIKRIRKKQPHLYVTA